MITLNYYFKQKELIEEKIKDQELCLDALCEEGGSKRGQELFRKQIKKSKQELTDLGNTLVETVPENKPISTKNLVSIWDGENSED